MPTMKALKQTKLAFTPLPKRDPSSSRSNNEATPVGPTTSSESPSKNLRPRKAVQYKTGRSRSSAMDCVEIPPPPKRSSRATSSTKALPLDSPLQATVEDTAFAQGQGRKPSLKRKLSPSPDSDAEGANNIARLPYRSGRFTTPIGNKLKAVSKASPKRIRLSSPTSELTPLPSGSSVDPDELVPTSQSDEQELTLPRLPDRDPAIVQESVARWREETHANPPSRAQSPPPLDPICTSFDDAPMDVDTILVQGAAETPSVRPLQYPQTPRSSSDGSSHRASIEAALTTITRPTVFATPASQAGTPTHPHKLVMPAGSLSDAFSSLTPPPSSGAGSPEPEAEGPLVQALDVKSKTEQLIADIKARAYAAAHSSPEQSSIDLDALSDSDSDSDSSCFSVILGKSKGKDKATTVVTSSKAGLSKVEQTSAPRYDLRRSPPKAKKLLDLAPAQPRKPRKTNPLDALLREKAREERTGTGMEAIRSASAAYAAAKAKEEARKGLQDEMDNEEGSDSDVDMDSQSGAVSRSANGDRTPRTPAGSRRARSKSVRVEESDNEQDLAAIDCEAILGSKGGKAVGKILESDLKNKKAQALAKLNEEPVGVPLWAVLTTDVAEDNSMDVDSALPSLAADVGCNSGLQLFVNAINGNDVSQVAALLASGFVTLLRPEQFQLVVPWLFETVFSNVPASLSVLAYTQLMRLAPLLAGNPSGLHPSFALSALVRIGAPHSVIAKYGWSVSLEQSPAFVASTRRDEMVYRFVTLVGVLCGPSTGEGLLEFFLMLLLIGMDPSTREEMLTEIRQSCNNVATVIEATQGDALDLEISLCEKLIPFGKTLSPSNQSRLISLFPCIAPSTTRMARNIGLALLMDGPIAPQSYEKLPDLVPIIDLLSPPSGSLGFFDITGNTDKEGYYDALACRITLLSRVLSDVDEYTMLEIRAAKEQATRDKERLEQATSDGRKEEKGEDKDDEKLTHLELIRRHLEDLHGKIFDTRAAHLDRSRAKAAIQRLTLRVHYQRIATLKSGSGTGKPRNLRGYFAGPTQSLN
ncbi:hypothetical protein C8Q79DRAFT_1091882 [Trametes meyenii]|nr:hypothetical protein C8Q79DRAFT_1091882 [Trametes meyenii]